jgi:hypothetical protein
MKQSTWFLFGDVLGNLLAGAMAAVVALWLTAPGDNMLLAMLWGMVVPMLLSMPLALLLGRYFGALELMITMMVSAMLAGMVVAMRAAMSELLLFDALIYGVLIALVVVRWVLSLNDRLIAPYLRGEADHEN